MKMKMKNKLEKTKSTVCELDKYNYNKHVSVLENGSSLHLQHCQKHDA